MAMGGEVPHVIKRSLIPYSNKGRLFFKVQEFLFEHEKSWHEKSIRTMKYVVFMGAQICTMCRRIPLQKYRKKSG